MKTFVGELEHITITSGAYRMSARSEVRQDVVAMIDEDLATRAGKICNTGWRVKLLPIPEGGHVFDLRHGGVRVVRCWLCADPGDSRAMWEAASAGAPDIGINLVAPCGVPWLAAALTAKSIAAMAQSRNKATDVLYQAGDLERCVAWVLLERGSRAPDSGSRPSDGERLTATANGNSISRA
jgi:hypothetical protein